MKIVVVACNTASAVALPALEAALAPMPVVGVIEPGAEAAVAAARRRPIAVIATEGTVKGGAYVRAIHARAPRCEVVQQACPLFVPLAEEGLIDGDIAERIAGALSGAAVRDMRNPPCLCWAARIFPCWRRCIEKVIARYWQGIPCLSTAPRRRRMPWRVCSPKRGLAQDFAAPPHYRFLATDAPERFARVGEIFLGRATRNPSNWSICKRLNNPRASDRARRAARRGRSGRGRARRALGHIARRPFAFADEFQRTHEMRT